MLVRIMLALDREPGRDRVRELLDVPGALVARLRRGEDLWKRLAGESFDLVAIGLADLPEPAADSIGTILALPGEPDVVVVGDVGDPESGAHLLAAGCLAVLDTRLSDDALGEALESLVARRREESLLRLQAAEESEYRLGDFVSASPAMKQLMTVARRVVGSDTTLLILGETGVGKEWLARAIHAEGPRSGGPFIAVNCSAIPETLLESELFGHEEGAFTGARRAHRGHFEMAHGGTIFLDEVAETPSHLQVKLLRVLQEKQFQRVGAERAIAVDVRIIAATNRDPQEEIRSGRFRTDLYYRLGVVTLALPPLRDRREDIPALVENYFEIFQVRLGRRFSRVHPDAMAALTAYDWPGNVRELINVVERAVLLATGPEIGFVDLPEGIAAASGRGRVAGDAGAAPAFAGAPPVELPLRDARQSVIAEFERRYLVALLERTRGRVGETARRAGITPRALFEKMRLYGLRKEDYR